MNGRRLHCCIVLFLKISCFYVWGKQNHFMSEQCTLENIPFLPIIFAKSEYLPDGPCKKDAQKFFHDLSNGSTWAMQMFDSSTKYPEGILYGHTRHLENFDQCYNLHINITKENEQRMTNNHEINGKYC